MERHILIVEPEHVIALEMQIRLGESGYVVSQSSGLADTRNALLQKAPDLIVADTTIKEDQGGFNELLSLWKKQNVPVIYISTKTQADIVIESGLEVIGVFSKPFSTNELLSLMGIFFKAKVREDRCTALTDTVEDMHGAGIERPRRIPICLFDALDPGVPIESEFAG